MQQQANPNTIVYFNNRYVALKDARIGILTHAFHLRHGRFRRHTGLVIQRSAFSNQPSAPS